MTLTTDHTFHIGEQHLRTGKPNQDYVMSGILSNGLAYAVVSDGCSSGGMTDIGSRLVTLATKRAIEKYAKPSTWIHKDEAVTEVNLLRDIYLEVYRESLGLGYQDLLATCLWAVSDQDSVLIHVTGDGVVGIQSEEDLQLHHFEWNKNAPYYPAYKLGSLDKQFKQAHEDSATPFVYTNGGAEEQIVCYDVNEGLAGHTIRLKKDGHKKTSVGLFSDGVELVDNFTYEETVNQLMAFKSTNGQFAVRRMNRFLKEASSIGKGPMDDISYAVIHLSQT